MSKEKATYYRLSTDQLLNVLRRRPEQPKVDKDVVLISTQGFSVFIAGESKEASAIVLMSSTSQGIAAIK